MINNMKGLHYEFTGETQKFRSLDLTEDRYVTLNRIIATKDLPENFVRKGDLGGWIEKVENLQGNAWVADNAKVYGEAMVFGNAKVYENAVVYQKSKVYGKARVYGDSKVRGEANISGEAYVLGNSFILDSSKVSGLSYVCGNSYISGNSYVFGRSHLDGNTKLFGNAYIGSDNDFCVLSKFGSINRDITFFTNICKKVFVYCGCFKGTLNEFVKEVKKTHKGTKYEREYLAMVELVKIKFNLL